jgi:hypothetical protein
MITMKTFIIKNIPDDLHKQFKLSCVDKGISMNQRFLSIIKTVVDRYQKPSGTQDKDREQKQ